jgi:hypothetical protein
VHELEGQVHFSCFIYTVRSADGGGGREAEVVNGVACCFMPHKIVSQFEILGNEKAPLSKLTHVVLGVFFISRYKHHI